MSCLCTARALSPIAVLPLGIVMDRGDEPASHDADRDASPRAGDGRRASAAGAHIDGDAALSESDQTVSDGDQTASDSDQMTNTTAFYDACRDRVHALLGEHADITVVESAIDACLLPDDEKAALWLWAIAPHDPAPLRTLHLGHGM